MRFVDVQETRQQRLFLVGRQGLAGQVEGAAQQVHGAPADHGTGVVEVERLYPFFLENLVEGADNVGGRVDQGAVEVESENIARQIHGAAHLTIDMPMALG